MVEKINKVYIASRSQIPTERLLLQHLVLGSYGNGCHLITSGYFMINSHRRVLALSHTHLFKYVYALHTCRQKINIFNRKQFKVTQLHLCPHQYILCRCTCSQNTSVHLRKGKRVIFPRMCHFAHGAHQHWPES